MTVVIILGILIVLEGVEKSNVAVLVNEPGSSYFNVHLEYPERPLGLVLEGIGSMLVVFGIYVFFVTILTKEKNLMKKREKPIPPPVITPAARLQKNEENIASIKIQVQRLATQISERKNAGKNTKSLEEDYQYLVSRLNEMESEKGRIQ